MSTDTPQGTDGEAGRTAVRLAYGGASGLVADGDGARLALFANLDRAPVQVDGVVRDALRLREALSALHAVVGSDFRYKPKDRTAWLAYQRQRQRASGTDTAKAQAEYFDWLARNDPTAWIMLDPIVSVAPDQLAFEVFSKDEGTYARLAVGLDALELSGKPAFGTTNIDFSDALFDGVQRMRSYRATRLSVGAEAVAVATEGQPEVIEKRIQVPDSWLRGFLQVQSAATLATTSFQVAPIDLYNLLRHLRLNADQKARGRALRVELVPGERPRLVLEPWEEVLETHADPYVGDRAQVVKVWGRRRLMLLRRWLPFAESVDVHLLGSGLPSFWVLRGGGFTFTLGMSGFTAANWSAAAQFDLLLPRTDGQSADLTAVLQAIEGRWSATAAELAKATKLKAEAVLRAAQEGCQQGVLMYDLAEGVYRLRPLLATPPDPARLRYRNNHERQAWDLLNTKGAVRITKENRIFGEGIELTGAVAVAADKREYRPQMLVTEDNRVRKAECTCAFYRQHKLKEGPCPHLIALRIRQAQVEADRLASRGKARASITVETRTYVRRHDRGEDVFRVSLDERRLRTWWGQRGQPLRAQNLFFNSVDDARDAYFSRVDDLEARGFLDATAG
ncbi:MAG: SWIM zinc finger family protein [Alphaproteobacteria bacterium]|nr:SWIM zinc finger family protein [Alphaproteobacteria bacterium]